MARRATGRRAKPNARCAISPSGTAPSTTTSGPTGAARAAAGISRGWTQPKSTPPVFVGATSTLLGIVRFPLKTAPGLNAREHWSVRQRRVRSEKEITGWQLAALNSVRACALPCSVILTRFSAGTLDGDNLQGALKAVRDAVATWLGVDDADPRVTWEYTQDRCPRGEHHVQITIYAAKP